MIEFMGSTLWFWVSVFLMLCIPAIMVATIYHILVKFIEGR